MGERGFIELKNISKVYGDKIILNNINLKINKGEFVTIIGSSGCGKTTLLRMIAGLNSITEGDLIFGEKRVNKLASKR